MKLHRERRRARDVPAELRVNGILGAAHTGVPRPAIQDMTKKVFAIVREYVIMKR